MAGYGFFQQQQQQEKKKMEMRGTEHIEWPNGIVIIMHGIHVYRRIE